MLLKEIKEYAINNNVPIITDEGLDTFLSLLKDKDINSFLEIGSAIGYSAINFCLNLNCYVTTIERKKDMYLKALENIKLFDLEKKITIINKDALELDNESLGKFDCIFIDAAKAQYEKFFVKYEKNLNKNGMIICDNLLFHGMIYKDQDLLTKNVRGLVRKILKFREFLKNNNKYDTTILDIGDGISISIKKD